MRTFLVCLGLLVSFGNVNAQSCGTTYSRSYSHSYRQAYSYGAPSYYAPSYAAPAKVYKEAYKEEYAPAFYQFVLALPVVKLPTYGAAYADPDAPTPQAQKLPSQSQQQPQAQASQMQQLLSQNTQILQKLTELDGKVSRVESRVEKLERVRGPQPQAAPQPKEEKPQPKDDDLTKAFLKVNADSCIACHSRSNAAKYGGDFVFTEDDGTLVKLTADQREEVERQIGGEKPKMPKLTVKRAKDSNVKPLNQELFNVIMGVLDRQKHAVRKD